MTSPATTSAAALKVGAPNPSVPTAVLRDLRALRARIRALAPGEFAVHVLTAGLFAVLFAKPFTLLLDAWWRAPRQITGWAWQ